MTESDSPTPDGPSSADLDAAMAGVQRRPRLRGYTADRRGGLRSRGEARRESEGDTHIGPGGHGAFPGGAFRREHSHRPGPVAGIAVIDGGIMR